MALEAEPSAWMATESQEAPELGSGDFEHLPYELQALARRNAQRQQAEEESLDEEERIQQEIAQLEAQSAEIDNLDELGPYRSEIAFLRNEATSRVAQQAADLAIEQGSRWIAKIAGHGGNALDTADAGIADMGITWATTFAYDSARAVTTVMIPEERPSDEAIQTEVAKKAAEIIFPRYRPLREPGDFLYFIFEGLVFGIIMTFVLGGVVIMSWALYEIGDSSFSFLSSVFG